jgi:hypothetical protein
MANKWLRTATIELADVICHARMIWGRDPDKARTTLMEDGRFCEYFGCGAQTALALWVPILSSTSTHALDLVVHESVCKVRNNVMLNWSR